MKPEYFSSHDLEGLVQHSRDLGWYSHSDWECFIRTGVVYGHRLQSGEIISSAYYSNFENRIGWLGAVIVNKRFQGKKLGRDLIQKALSILPDPDFVLAVIATERGKKMYEQAGFVEVGNTHKFVLDAPQSVNDSENQSLYKVRIFREADIDAILLLDVQATGYRRPKLLREKLKVSLKCLVIEDQNNTILGFSILSNDGADRVCIGPIVATEPAHALALTKSAIVSGGKYRLDVPHWQSEFIRLASAMGFQLERICPLLTYKGKPLPFTSDSYFAIMAQALG